MLRLLKTTSLLQNSGRILAANLPSIGAKANYAAMPEPNTNPDVLYTGVSIEKEAGRIFKTSNFFV